MRARYNARVTAEQEAGYNALNVFFGNTLPFVVLVIDNCSNVESISAHVKIALEA